MVLLKIDPSSLSFVKLEGDTPRPVDMNRIARWAMTAQSMKVEARQIQVRYLRCGIKRVEH